MTELSAKEFGRYLRELRESRGLSTRQVKLQSGVSNAYISLLENGERGIPSPEILEKLARVYRVPYDKLMKLAGYIKSDSLDTHTPSEKELEFLKQLRETLVKLPPEEQSKRLDQMLLILRVMNEIDDQQTKNQEG